MRQPVELSERRLGVLSGLYRQRVHAASVSKDAMGGENREAGILEADEHDHHVPALRSPDLLVVRERRLVAVMAVRDQEPPIGEGCAELLVGQSPETGALDLEVGRTVRRLERSSALVEQEDRLELGAHLAK